MEKGERGHHAGEKVLVLGRRGELERAENKNVNHGQLRLLIRPGRLGIPG